MWPTRADGSSCSTASSIPRPGSQHRHHDDVARHAPPFGLLQRRLNDGALGRQIAQRLGDQQHADAIGDLAEVFRLGVDVAKLAERVVNQRMWNEMD